MSQRVIDTIEVPAEVREFAREQGVEEYVPVVVETGARCFPGATFRLVLEEDPEVVGMKHIVLIVEGLNWEVEQYLAANDAYHRGLFAAIPAPLICTFRLGLGG